MRYGHQCNFYSNCSDIYLHFQIIVELIAFQESRHTSYEYGHYGNPTTQVAEKKINALEQAKTTLLLAKGMCAPTTMMLALVPTRGT